MSADESLVTHIEGFDDIFNPKGIPKRTTIIITGPPGSGKTTFIMDFIVKGILKSNDIGIFVTLEETAENIIKDYRSFSAWRLEELIRSDRLFVIDAITYKVSKMTRRPLEEIESIGDLQDEKDKIIYLSHVDELAPCLDLLIELIRKEMGHTGDIRLGIDSLTAYLSARAVRLDIRTKFEFLDRVRDEILSLRNMLEKKNVTTFMSAEAIKEVRTRFGVEEFVARGMIYIGYSWVGMHKSRYLAVIKMRGREHSLSKYSFDIDPKTGIRIFGEVV